LCPRRLVDDDAQHLGHHVHHPHTAVAQQQELVADAVLRAALEPPQPRFGLVDRVLADHPTLALPEHALLEQHRRRHDRVAVDVECAHATGVADGSDRVGRAEVDGEHPTTG
jgi:hypothetical protein